MDLNEQGEGERSVPSNSANLTNSSEYNSKFSGMVNQIHSLNKLHVIVACTQIILGLSVVFLSVFGLIRPLWFSTILSMAASVSTMLGLYFLYVTLGKIDSNTLLRDAMRRIMDAQN